MIEFYRRNSFVNDTFDQYNWSANLYETPEEIIEYVSSLNLKGRTVQGITAIGAIARSTRHQAVKQLCEAGIIEKIDRRNGQFHFSDGTVRKAADCEELLGNVTIDRVVSLHEPMSILFDDTTTLDIQPCGSAGVRIAYNSIPQTVKDGLNHREYDIGIQFNDFLQGKEFYSIVVKKVAKAIHGCSSSYGENGSNYHTYEENTCWYLLSFQIGECELILKSDADMEYDVMVSCAETVRCKDFEVESNLSFRQKVLLPFGSGGGAMIIYPVRMGNTHEEPDETCPWEYLNVGLSLPALIDPLLSKYFDDELFPNKANSRTHFDHYYWNHYSRDAMTLMLNEFESLIEQFERQSFAARWEMIGWQKLNRTQQQLEELLATELDYSKRFLIRMRGMVTHIPENDTIDIVGP